MAVDISTVLKVANLVIGIVCVVTGFSKFFSIVTLNVASFVAGVYLILFGLCLLALEFKAPDMVLRNFGFLGHTLGRGGFYIWLSLYMLGDAYTWISTTITMATGILYLFIHFKAPIPSGFSTGAPPPVPPKV